jgi:hypothetical protein
MAALATVRAPDEEGPGVMLCRRSPEGSTRKLDVIPGPCSTTPLSDLPFDVKLQEGGRRRAWPSFVSTMTRLPLSPLGRLEGRLVAHHREGDAVRLVT